MNYSEIKTGLNQLAADIDAERKRIASGRTQINMAGSNLAGYPAKYGALVTAIGTFASENPDDAAAKLAAAEKDRLVAEFQLLKSEADALVQALNGE